MLMPAIRAMALPLTLLVTGVRADHEDGAVAPDDLALLAHRLDRGSNFHGPFRLTGMAVRLGGPRAAARARRTRRSPKRAASSATANPSKASDSGRVPLPLEVPWGEDPGA